MLIKTIEKFFSEYDLLKPKDWQLLRELSFVKEFEKGEIISPFCKTENAVYFIIEGMTRLYGLKDGKEITFEFFFENQFCSSFTSFLTREPSVVQLEALNYTKVVGLSYQNYNHILDSSFPINKLSRILLQKNLLYRTNRERSLLFHTAEERYHLLLESRPKVFEKVPQYMIASYLNLTPETLSRVISKNGKPK